MYYLKTSAEFDSAHFLSGYDGKCSNLHGHRWKIEVQASETELQKTGQCRGMVIDFGDLKKLYAKSLITLTMHCYMKTVLLKKRLLIH